MEWGGPTALVVRDRYGEAIGRGAWPFGWGRIAENALLKCECASIDAKSPKRASTPFGSGNVLNPVVINSLFILTRRRHHRRISLIPP
jgi:hypothetical protein